VSQKPGSLPGFNFSVTNHLCRIATARDARKLLAYVVLRTAFSLCSHFVRWVADLPHLKQGGEVKKCLRHADKLKMTGAGYPKKQTQKTPSQ
jgi:hypothetical protein